MPAEPTPADAMAVDPPAAKEATPVDPVVVVKNGVCAQLVPFPASPPVPHPLPHLAPSCADLKAAVVSIDRFVSTREPRFIAAALRVADQLRVLEKKEGCGGQGATLVSVFLSQGLPLAHPLRDTLLGYLSPLATPLTATDDEKKEDEKKRPLGPEAEMFGLLLVLLLLIDAKRFEEATRNPIAPSPPPCRPHPTCRVRPPCLIPARPPCPPIPTPWPTNTLQSLACATALVERLSTWNRRTMDPVAERVYFYASWAYECAGKLQASAESPESPALPFNAPPPIPPSSTCLPEMPEPPPCTIPGVPLSAPRRAPDGLPSPQHLVPSDHPQFAPAQLSAL